MEQGNISLNLNDLKNVINVIDYAAAQGAFKGWDTIRQVMEVREKVAVFLQAAEIAEQNRIQALQDAQAAQAAQAEQAVASEVEITYEEEPKPRKKSAKK